MQSECKSNFYKKLSRNMTTTCIKVTAIKLNIKTAHKATKLDISLLCISLHSEYISKKLRRTMPTACIKVTTINLNIKTA